MLKKIISLFIATILLLTSLLSLTSCDKNDKNATKISFKNTESIEDLKSLNGKTVSLCGYMATLTPSNGSFVILMNLPYQSCPFCKPNTSELTNSIDVYPKKGKKFSYTDKAVKVVGTLMVTEDENNLFVDSYGYKSSFKIVDATCTVMKSSDMEIDAALWNSIAASGIVNELYDMQNYINFLARWPSYSVENQYDSSGNLTSAGYFLYASDAKNSLTKEKGQFHYGYVDGYFDKLIAKIKAIDETKLNDLVANVESAKAFAEKCLKELNDGNYTYEKKYVEKFGTEDYVYKLDKASELETECDAIYEEFSRWLNSWEM